jgi:hypothetical protein
MSYRYTVQYADPEGSFPLSSDAAWQLYSTSDDATDALGDVQEARAGTYGTYGYAVRILDGDDVILTDVPLTEDRAVIPRDSLGKLRSLTSGKIDAEKLADAVADVIEDAYVAEQVTR